MNALSKLFFPPEMHQAPRLPNKPTPTPTARHALLINPFYAKDPRASFGKHVLTPSLALTSIAASTPAHWSVAYWDENLLQGPPPSDPFPEVVGITVHLTFAERAYALAAWYRARGAKVIMGGLHALSCPDEVTPHCDSIALGEGVQVWGQALLDFEQGKLQARYDGSYRHPYREEPAPRRDLLPRDGFLTTTSVIATRGCHNRCGFCYLSTEGLKMPYQMRDPAQIAAELADDDQPYAVFIDNNLGSKPAYLRALCRELRPLNKIWSAAVTLDVTDDPALVKEMALAGCTGVFVGLESLNNENIVDQRKKSPPTIDYARRVRVFHDVGIQVNGSFVLGFDHDGPDVFEKTVSWAEDHRLECATFHILTPYPGTPQFKQLQTEGRLLHKDWSKYDTSHVVFQPKRMSVAQLEEGYDWCYQRMFSASSIWARRPEDRRAVPAYLAMSTLYKRSNRFWHQLIKHRMTHKVWRPLVEVTRQRHLSFRRALERQPTPAAPYPTCERPRRSLSVVTAGV